MRIVTSFSGRLYYSYGRDALVSMVKNAGEYPILAFHEDSNENSFPLGARHICEVDKIDGVEYTDLFKVDTEIAKIINYPEFNLKHDHMNISAPNFFRKIAAIRQAVKKYPNEIVLWLDSDSFVRKQFDSPILQFVMQHDICHIDREHMPTESGVIFFNTNNPMVLSFVERWYDLFRSKEIFKTSQWADHYAFDYTRKMYFRKLKYGRLNSGVGAKLWIDFSLGPRSKRESDSQTNWRYILHIKGPNTQIRAPYVGHNGEAVNQEAIEKKVGPISIARRAVPVNEQKNSKGHLYISFGTEYDNVAAHSCCRLRKFSNLPIHVVTNLTAGQRSPKWKEVVNISFRVHNMKDDENRDIKTMLPYYSPFDLTLYTDADSLIHSVQFMEVFQMLKKDNLLMPVWKDNVKKGSLRKYQDWSYTRAMEIINTPEFNTSSTFTAYGGGICAFRKTEAVHKFFVLFNQNWEKCGRLRDMPALAATAAMMKGKISIGHLSDDYNKVDSKIIQSCHTNTRSYDGIPDFVRFHPDDHTGKWEHREKRAKT